MTREKLKLGNFTYIADLYRSGYDFKEQYYDKYVILRNYEIYNEVIVDKDIYFIERSLYYDAVREMLINNTDLTDIFTFPIPFSNLTGYSNDYHSFNGLYNENSFYQSKNVLYKKYFEEINKNQELKNEIYKEYQLELENKNVDISRGDYTINSKNFNEYIEFVYFKKWVLNCPEEYIKGNEVYELYTKDESNKIIDIKCDKIKVYIPLMKQNISGIIHINNYINNINFHFYCRNTDKIKINSENLFNYNNQSYCEYYEIFFPNIEYLFKEVYFYEDLNIQISKKNEKFIESISGDNKNIGFGKMNLKILTQPFEIVDEYIPESNQTLKVKQYKKLSNSVFNNYLLYPIGLSFYSYSEIENSTNLYLLDEKYNSHEILFVIDNKFRLSATLNFNDKNEICVYAKFLYDNKYTDMTSFIDLYCYYNDVKYDEYYDYKNKMLISLKEELTELYNFNTQEELNDYINNYKEEIKEEYNVDFDFIGFYISIYTDDKGQNLIWNKKIPVDMEDFKEEIYIPISGLFNKWTEVPDKLICDIKFYDKFLGLIIRSNPLIIPKEYIKFIISDINLKLTNLIEISKNNTTIDMENNSINFINNITCVINKKENQELINNSKLNTGVKVLYKPYFFKVQDLQNIKLRSKIVQNIGINLNQYMTKVETFKLIMDGNEYIEIGRNDSFVIFSVDANNITQGGRYDIFNEDDDYISSGEYSIY